MNLSTEPGPVHKYMFDRSFDDASILHRAQERKPVLMKPEQVDALKKESYDAGFDAGKAAGLDAQTTSLNLILIAVDQSITSLVENLDKLSHEQNLQTRQLVMAIAKKILPDHAARGALQEIEALLTETLKDMAREPRLVVRIHETDFDAVNERIQTIATQRAYSGKVIVLADPDVVSGDCRVEWADGGIERNASSTWAKIEHTVLPS